jgi:hypothetical protein
VAAYMPARAFRQRMPPASPSPTRTANSRRFTPSLDQLIGADLLDSLVGSGVLRHGQ